MKSMLFFLSTLLILGSCAQKDSQIRIQKIPSNPIVGNNTMNSSMVTTERRISGKGMVKEVPVAKGESKPYCEFRITIPEFSDKDEKFKYYLSDFSQDISLLTESGISMNPTYFQFINDGGIKPGLDFLVGFDIEKPNEKHTVSVIDKVQGNELKFEFPGNE